MTPEEVCDCPSCRSTPVDRFCKAFPDDEARGRWFTRITGRAPSGKIADELKGLFADRAAARRLLDRLGPESWVPLAILAEAPGGISRETLAYEVTALLGARAVAALSRLNDAGLIFETRPVDQWGYRPKDDQPDYVLPDALSRWLRPLLDGLLAASDIGPPGDPAEPAAGPQPDPGWLEAIALAAVATVRPRLTNGRLYKKDAQRLGALIGPAGLGDPDDLVLRLRSMRLVSYAAGPTVLLTVNQPAVDEWAALPPVARGRERLQSLHGAHPLWTYLLGSQGQWVQEAHLARRFRITRHVRIDPLKVRPGQPERAWQNERSLTLERWPEVEQLSSGGADWWRLRPEHARALVAADAPAAKVHVQPDFEVIVPREAAIADVAFLSRIGELKRADVVTTFALTPAAVRRAAQAGLSPREIIARMGAMAAHGVPAAVERAIADWCGDVGRCTVREAVLITFDDATIADRAAKALGRSARRIGPTVFAADIGTEAEVQRLLEGAGMHPRGEDEAPAAEEVPEVVSRHPPEPAGAVGPPEPALVEALRRARAGDGTAARSAPPAQPSHARRRGLPLPPAVALPRAVKMGADVLVRKGARTLLVTPLRSTAAGTGFVVNVDGTGEDEELRLDELTDAVLLPSTARLVARNNPCPCGSGLKFKRCCMDEGRWTAAAELGGGGA